MCDESKRARTRLHVIGFGGGRAEIRFNQVVEGSITVLGTPSMGYDGKVLINLRKGSVAVLGTPVPSMGDDGK